jgi:hypothetical protein
MLNALRRIVVDREDEPLRLSCVRAPEPTDELDHVDVQKCDAAEDDVEVARRGEDCQGDLARPHRYDLLIAQGLNKDPSGERVAIDHEHPCAARFGPGVRLADTVVTLRDSAAQHLQNM